MLAAIFIPKFKGDDDMAKRKKHPRLPNGYGQIRFLGKNRRNPYGVYPPAKEEYENGQMKPQKAICYVSDWMIGFAVLTAYKAGTYTPGMENDIQVDDKRMRRILSSLCLQIIIRCKELKQRKSRN